MSFSHDFVAANSRPDIHGIFKSQTEDFFVEEQLGFEPTGSGEHLCLFIEKKGLSTPQLAKILSRYCNVAAREISYAGLKDKRGICRQWFSIRLQAGKPFVAAGLEDNNIKLLRVDRNSRKIRRGSHKGNVFKLRIRKLKGNLKTLAARVELIRKEGVPNYYGPQRFGSGRENVEQGRRYLSGSFPVKDRFLRSIYISAVRSWLFNYLLSQRVEQENWNRYLNGDVMALEGSASYFVPEMWDQVLQLRLETLDIHPTGALWGKGVPPASDEAAILELKLRKSWPELCQGLEQQGLKQGRRALRLKVERLSVATAGDNNLMIEFGLGKGAYATSVLRELVNLET